MPLDYSKWNNIEISDDEDIEVHPNVDKRSFIKWNREAIHQRRAERRTKIQQLQERIQLNGKVINKIKMILDWLIRSDQNIQNIFNQLEQKATERQSNYLKLDEEELEPNKTDIEKMMLNMFSQIQADLAKEKLEFTKENVLSKLQSELEKVEDHLFECRKELEAEIKIEQSTLTCDNICKPGFDKTILTKSTTPSPAAPKKVLKKEKTIEILNPKTLATTPVSKPVTATDRKAVENEETGDSEAEVEISDLAAAFSKLKAFEESFDFITKYPYFVDERYSDELLAHAFECELKKEYAYAEQCVLQSLIITYCIKLGKDGVNLFFKRLNSEGLEMFKKDARETYLLLKERAKVIASKASEGSGKRAVFQLEPASEDSKFVVNIPTEDDTERYKLFTSLPTALQEGLKTAEIEPINKALAELTEQEAEQALHLCDQGAFLLFDVPGGQPETSQPATSTSQSWSVSCKLIIILLSSKYGYSLNQSFNK